MATLNIKNLSDDLFEKLRERARQQHRSVTQEVTQILERALETPKPLSLLDLRGLGKSTWRTAARASWRTTATFHRSPACASVTSAHYL